MLEKIGKFLYHTIFINIHAGDKELIVYIERKNTKGLVESEEKVFDTDTINDEMKKYINFFTKDTPYFYISFLDSSTSQGAAPTCEHIEISKFYDKALCKYGCYNNKWSYYTSKFDLDEIENDFSDLGLDFVFSPFIILANFFKDKIESHLAIFVLIQKDSISLSIFDTSELLYAQYICLKDEFETTDEFSIDSDDSDEITLEDVSEDSIDLDSIDIDDDLDVFGDIEDLDSIEEIDEFTDIEEDLEEESTSLNQSSHKNTMSESGELFDEDFQMFSLIQASIKTFYEDEKYNSKFVENIYIADSIGINGDLKNYLEEEMFLNVYVRQINLGVEISELAQSELK